VDNFGRAEYGCKGVDMPGKVAIKVVLNPVARLLWRAVDVVQLELGGRAVLVEGADPAVIRQLVARRSPNSKAGNPPVVWHDDATRHSLVALAEAGYLWPSDDDGSRMAPPEPRLAPDLAALAARHGTVAAELLNARRHCAVSIHGAGRAAAQIAALLAAAGVGRVHVLDTAPVRLHQLTPGGVTPHDEGRPFGTAVEAAIRRAAPEVDTTPLPMGERPDLVVLAVDEPSGETHCTPVGVPISWCGSAPTTASSARWSSRG
jgi:hypothetical protein